MYICSICIRFECVCVCGGGGGGGGGGCSIFLLPMNIEYPHISPHISPNTRSLDSILPTINFNFNTTEQFTDRSRFSTDSQFYKLQVKRKVGGK